VKLIVYLWGMENKDLNPQKKAFEQLKAAAQKLYHRQQKERARMVHHFLGKKFVVMEHKPLKTEWDGKWKAYKTSHPLPAKLWGVAEIDANENIVAWHHRQEMTEDGAYFDFHCLLGCLDRGEDDFQSSPMSYLFCK
jgi:hypothetical protein